METRSSSKKNSSGSDAEKKAAAAYKKYADTMEASEKMKNILKKAQNDRKTQKARAFADAKLNSSTESQKSEDDVVEPVNENKFVNPLQLARLDPNGDPEQLAQSLSPEELQKLNFTTAVVKTLLDALDAANKYIRAHRADIVRDFAYLLNSRRQLDKRSCGGSTYVSLFPSAEFAIRMTAHTEALGLIGRYRQSDEDSAFFEELLEETDIVANEACSIYLEQIGPSLLSAIAMGGTRVAVRFASLVPSKNDFWYLFLSNRCMKTLSIALEEKGFKIVTYKKPTDGGAGLDMYWLISWSKDATAPASPLPAEKTETAPGDVNSKETSEDPMPVSSSELTNSIILSSATENSENVPSKV